MVDVRGEERREVQLVRDIEEKIKGLREAKGRGGSNRLSFHEQRDKLGGILRPRGLANQSQPNVMEVLRENDIVRVSPLETININPQFIVSVIQPLIMQQVKSYLKRFKETLLDEIKEELTRKLELGIAEYDYDRRNELRGIQNDLVIEY